jgi:serine/threonine protein kinase
MKVFLGSTFGFAGSACPKKVHMDPLTPMLPLAWNPYEKGLSIMAARTFAAFKKAVHNLKMYYENEFPPETLRNPEFPYKWDYKDGDTTVYFKYVSQPIKEKLIFFAKNNMDKDICIKFVHQYSAEAHNHSANKAYAPHLYSCEHIPGGWLMIVMDYIDLNAYSTYDQYSVSFPSVDEVKSKINDIVKHLHEGNWVHGDLRSSNFLVRMNGDNNLPLVMLIDFDWAGKEMVAQYPLDINISSVTRPNGVKGGELIRKEHDDDMLAIMWKEKELQY